VLNIFEPRYRAMYNDILFNGSRQFAVCMSNQFDNRFSQVAVVFYLDDLKEVSEQTDDRIKFICSHKVCRRHFVLPPPTLLRVHTVALVLTALGARRLKGCIKKPSVGDSTLPESPFGFNTSRDSAS
jgi:hypothetical protein